MIQSSRRMLAVLVSLRTYPGHHLHMELLLIAGSHIKGKASHKIVSDGKNHIRVFWRLLLTIHSTVTALQHDASRCRRFRCP